MAFVKDKTGKRFGAVVVVKQVPGRNKSGHTLWLCICDCGETKVVVTNELRKNGISSCGCLTKNILSLANTTHGLSGTPEYNVWAEIKGRCTNPRHKEYHNYGDRGVHLCDSWKKFENFIEDMGKRPSPRHQIDRENNDGDYEPGNCRWVLPLTNARNQRRSKYWFVNSVRYESLRDAAVSEGVHHRVIESWCKGRPERCQPPKPNCWSELKYPEKRRKT